MGIRYLVLLLSTVLLLNACASGTPRPTVDERLLAMGLERGEGNQRIPRYRINGWTAIDDYNLVITAGVNDRYLVTLRSPCFNLNNVFAIGFTTPTGGLDRFESIIVRQPGRGREYCPISDIVGLRQPGD